jgi:hypothetical protein
MDYTETDIRWIAGAFVAELKECLSKEEFKAMCVANATEPMRDSCYSHDYVDANEYMLQAMEARVGTAPACPINGSWADVPWHEAWSSIWFTDLWNASWAMAKSEYMTDGGQQWTK